ncbi:aminoglycoside phosphotransferase family protein [Cobetia sp. QF-1]|uniref:aminoglycoside phosphotransferase family protein n=1 Tax=Cobetia sp. QF-1 TaxID=1969833 RepID=UPI001595C7B4|nr:phosphotransferase [Cobetia sp. QF-1]
MTSDARRQALHAWAAARHDLTPEVVRMSAVADDASFRRYFRLHLEDTALSIPARILMDAPPEKEDSHGFVAIARQWREAGLPLPTVHAFDETLGFLELEDLGDTPLMTALTSVDAADHYYGEAIGLLEVLHELPLADLPAYDDANLKAELDLFPEWCLGQLLDMPHDRRYAAWESLSRQLLEAARAQPVVTVHRDFHAQNLFLHADASQPQDHLWIIDFQDAVTGPENYDLVSLLRDRHWRWPEPAMARWIEQARLAALPRYAVTGLPAPSPLEYRQSVERMGVQRNLKILGIFARLTLRDAKPRYLTLMPRFLGHLREGLAFCPELTPFTHWLDEVLTPALSLRLAHESEVRDLRLANGERPEINLDDYDELAALADRAARLMRDAAPQTSASEQGLT